MSIEKLGPIDPIAKPKKTGKSAPIESQKAADTVALSQEARRSAALQRTAEIVRASPDIRMDRVEEVKAKLQDPHYIDDVLIGATADRIMDILDLS